MGRSPAPVVFNPSQEWHGNDGNWSSFILRVGDPAQNFYVLPASATGEIVLPHPKGCISNGTNLPDCGARRGVMSIEGQPSPGFQPYRSVTWKDMGTWDLGLETRLEFDIGAAYGTDQVGLMLQNSGGATLLHQVVGTIKDYDVYVGLFGLSPFAANFSNYENPIQSYMTTLKDEKIIPSLSYSYTAGAYYKSTAAYGSLTLGGYDESRMEANNVTFPFDGDEGRALKMHLYDILAQDSNANNSRSLLNQTLYIELDFTVSHFWLPPEICDRLAEEFGLLFDNTTDLYLVDNDAHGKLIDRNPNITFTIGTSIDPAQQVSIVLPYSSFDLQATRPIYENATSYFPIRRGNSTQWTLGRAFMQEAYVIVDYERSEFKVHQAKFPAPRDQSIVPIYERGYVPSSQDPLSGGSIAGLMIGVVALVGFCILVYWMVTRKVRKANRSIQEADASESDAKLDNLNEKDGSITSSGKAELCSPWSGELEGSPTVELACPPVELPTPTEKIRAKSLDFM